MPNTMCDFHSIVVRADGAVAHVAENSHSTAVSKAGWRENEPLKRPVFIEAEWDGIGEYPGVDEICRVPDGEKMTPVQRKAVDGHYRALAAILQGKPSKAARFAEPEYADVVCQANIQRPEVPKLLGYLHRRLFTEMLGRDREYALAYPQRFREAIAPGADLALVYPRFMLWMLVDPKAGVIKFAKKKATQEAIKGVAALFQRWLDGCKPPASEWESARRKAYAAAAAYAYDAYAAAAAYAYDAYAAAAAYAYDAYDAYADAAAAAYAYDAYAAAAYAYDAYADAARRKHYVLMADKLLDILREAKRS
jgi:hypothetical protein